MSTFLFHDIIFGPLESRRLGQSLGINLLSTQCKVCTFNCIYCECGWTVPIPPDIRKFVEPGELMQELRHKGKSLRESGVKVDHITFAGNGEPSLHPRFEHIVDEVIAFRNEHLPGARTAILSNSSTLQKPQVFRALQKLDSRIMKLDCGTEQTFKQLNQPLLKTSLEAITNHLIRFEGKLTIQTMFVKGSYQGKRIDNTDELEIKAWLDRVAAIHPEMVMIYSLDRDTPVEDLQAIPAKKLDEIGAKIKKLGLPVMIR